MCGTRGSGCSYRSAVMRQRRGEGGADDLGDRATASRFLLGSDPWIAGLKTKPTGPMVEGGFTQLDTWAENE